MARVLVLSPHPDDEAIGCGGTICRHVSSGDSVRVVFLTSGELGGHGAGPAETAARRENEAMAASRILGVSESEFWRLPDGQLQADEVSVTRLARLLDDWQPGFIYTTHARETHRDHRAAARLLRRALGGSRLPSPSVYAFEIWTPLQHVDLVVDITRWIETKIHAVRAYESQCAVVRFDEAVRGLNRYRGEMHSWPEGDYAEVFASVRP